MEKQDLVVALRDLGVSTGDTLLVRADLGEIGRLTTKNRMDYLDALLDAVGSEGTIVGLSFTGAGFLKRDKRNIFDGTNKSYTGAFANLMLAHPSALRSAHPTNSYVAIGKNAVKIIGGHDENSGAYEPIRRLIELNGKMLLIGCVDKSPGFTTTHLAEVDLGLHKRIIAPWLNTCFYKKGNDILLFKRRDMGSCSSTFYKLYGYYVYEKKLIQGYVGNAYTVMINAMAAYETDIAVLNKYPKITICDNPSCFLCRARRWDNLKDAPSYLLRKGVQLIKRKLFNEASY